MSIGGATSIVWPRASIYAAEMRAEQQDNSDNIPSFLRTGNHLLRYEEAPKVETKPRRRLILVRTGTSGLPRTVNSGFRLKNGVFYQSGYDNYHIPSAAYAMSASRNKY